MIELINGYVISADNRQFKVLKKVGYSEDGKPMLSGNNIKYCKTLQYAFELAYEILGRDNMKKKDGNLSDAHKLVNEIEKRLQVMAGESEQMIRDRCIDSGCFYLINDYVITLETRQFQVMKQSGVDKDGQPYYPIYKKMYFNTFEQALIACFRAIFRDRLRMDIYTLSEAKDMMLDIENRLNKIIRDNVAVSEVDFQDKVIADEADDSEEILD